MFSLIVKILYIVAIWVWYFVKISRISTKHDYDSILFMLVLISCWIAVGA